LFSILGKSVQGAKVLDLFAGTGAMGLEAFSRNADFVVFIDKNRLALDLIKKNIGLCLSGYSGICGLRVIQHDLIKGLPPMHFIPETEAGFDLIFADPPYGKNFSQSLLKAIAEINLLAENGILIVEERFDISLPNTAAQLNLIDKRVYGETGFWLYKSSC